jgi:hypothetical protein
MSSVTTDWACWRSQPLPSRATSCSLSIPRGSDAAEVVEQAVAGLQAEPPQLTDVATDPLDLDALLGRPLPGPGQRLVDELDRRDLPAVARQVDGVAAGPATDVERATGLQGKRALEQRPP